MKKTILIPIIGILLVMGVYAITYGTRSNSCTGCSDYYTIEAKGVDGIDNASYVLSNNLSNINVSNASYASKVNCAGIYGGSDSDHCTDASGGGSESTNNSDAIIRNLNITGNLTIPKNVSINLYSAEGLLDQESINFYALTKDAKPYLTWWNTWENPIQEIGWIGCHQELPNGDLHQHCSWETWDNTSGTIESRLEIPFNQPTADMAIRVINVKNFSLGAGVQLVTQSNIFDRSNFDFYPDAQGTYSLIVGTNDEGISLQGGGGSVITSNSDFLISNDKFTLNGTGNAQVIASRGGAETSEASLILSNATTQICGLQMIGEKNELLIRKRSSGTNFINFTRNDEILLLRPVLINSNYVQTGEA